MNPQKNQGAEESPLFRDLQAEVSSESAPLLQFMLRHAGLIAGVVILFLLVLGGTAIWKWHSGSTSAEARQELARITLLNQGQERIKALTTLAEKAPGPVRLTAYLTLGQSAVESGDFAAAAQGLRQGRPGRRRRRAGHGRVVGEAGALLKAGKNAEALTLLQNLETRLPVEARSPQIRLMLAEARPRRTKGSGRRDLCGFGQGSAGP